MKKHRIRHGILLLICYLSLHNGHLAIWNNTEPIEVLPYAAHMYPPADQQALQQGIPFSTNKERHRLLEDYLS